MDDPDADGGAEAIEIALAVAFLTGALLLIVGALRLGDSVQRYLSPALVGGFHSGAAIHVMVSQFSHVLGVDRPAGVSGEFQIPRKIIYYCTSIPNANWVAFCISLGAMLIIWVCKNLTRGTIRLGEGRLGVRHVAVQDAVQLRFPVPGELIVAVLFEIISSAANLHDTHGLRVVGE